ncbi:MAG TPA: ATP-binding protein [Gaiellaceae bacterium]|jgi:signal transduction histidine kinase|nr:ATP-binding protein [Gaiellaceae bacterium]
MEFVASKVVSTTHNPARDPGPADDLDPRPRIVLRFAIYTGVVLLLAGLATLWIVNREVADRATRTVETQARVVAEENLRSHLRASDFVAPVSARRRQTLDTFFRNSILIPGVVGARLVNRDGRITYAARHQLIGTRVTYPQALREVLSGGLERRVTRTTTWRGEQDVKVLQALIPVKLAPSAAPLGALELDQDYRAVDVGIGDARTRLALILVAALLALYVSLFPILRRITRQLEARNRRLREHAEERGRLLESERAARADAEAAQRLLSEQNQRLRELDRLKDEFVSLVSHELRTPLTSIRGYLELLLDEGSELTEEQRRFLVIVDRNSERLLSLVSDLLFLAQIEAGKLAIEVGVVDLETIVEECVETWSPVASARGVALACTTDELPELQGDRTRLVQVLDNLVSNALKFTPGGGRVEVRLTAADGLAALEVEDTGLGIPADEQPRLFERFFRSSSATKNAIPGSGLGLTITKAIVEHHGGRIELESTENVGTIVRVELPLTSERSLDLPARELAA